MRLWPIDWKNSRAYSCQEGQASKTSGNGTRNGYEFFYERFEVEVHSTEADKLLVGQLTAIRMTGQSVSSLII